MLEDLLFTLHHFRHDLSTDRVKCVNKPLPSGVCVFFDDNQAPRLLYAGWKPNFVFCFFFLNEFQIECHLAMRKTLKLNKKRNFYSINHLYQFPCYGTKKSMQNEKKIVSVMWWVARQAREKKVFLMAMTGKCREIKIMMTLAQFSKFRLLLS